MTLSSAQGWESYGSPFQMCLNTCATRHEVYPILLCGFVSSAIWLKVSSLLRSSLSWAIGMSLIGWYCLPPMA